MADKVRAARDEADWNLLIGDDTSGRLPVFFLRQVLKADGRDLKTRYVVGSSGVRARLGEAAYTDYFLSLAEQCGEPLRPLIVTESTNSGRTVRFLRRTLQPVSATEPQAAAVVDGTATGEVDFAGTTDRAAGYDVFYTFESVAVESLRGRLNAHARRMTPRALKQLAPLAIKSAGLVPADGLTGVCADPHSDRPLARRLPTPRTAHSYQAVSRLVTEYLA